MFIEDVSGQPFEQYVEVNILQLLGMTRTTFRQPLLRDLAPGNSEENDTLTVLPLIRACMAPQGGLYTTAADMGRFLQMLLNRGVLDDVRIAKPETVNLMLNQQFTDDPRLPGITFGLFEIVHRGQRLLVRDGDGLGTRSRLALIPEAGLGLCSGSKYHGAFVRLPWYQTPDMQWLWLVLCVVMLASTLLWIPGFIIGAIRRKLALVPFLARVLGIVVGGLFGLLVLAAFGQLFVVDALAGIHPLAFGINQETADTLNAPWLPTLLTIGLVVFAVGICWATAGSPLCLLTTCSQAVPIGQAA